MAAGSSGSPRLGFNCNTILPKHAQISMNLLRDKELVQLIAASGGRWIFMGLESMEPDTLKAAHKGFNKPEEYAAILTTLAKYDLYAITSFIYGMEADQPGVSKKPFTKLMLGHQACQYSDCSPPIRQPRCTIACKRRVV
jgi:hypothetical protein